MSSIVALQTLHYHKSTLADSMDTFNSILVSSTPNEQKIFIFIVMGFAVLVPLVLITAMFSITSYSSFIKSVLIITSTMFLSTLLAAIVLMFPLKTQRLLLSTSDSEIFDASTYRVFCEYISFHNKEKRSPIDIWKIETVNVKYVRKNVQLNSRFKVSLDQLKVLPFSLRSGDLVSIKFAQRYHVNVSLITGLDSYKVWAGLNFPASQLGSCCSVGKLQVKSKEVFFTAQTTGISFIVFYLSLSEDSLLLRKPKLTVHIELTVTMNRTLPEPGPCDSSLCLEPSDEESSCTLNHFPRKLVVSKRYRPSAHQLIKSDVIDVVCHPRSWVFGIIFGLLPIVLLFGVIFLINYTSICQLRKRLRGTEIKMDLV